jgi:DMSO/TMAO reductase YedYZ heme-binding membrane subunit
MNDQGTALPADRLWQPTTGKWFAVIFGGSVAYAIVRYHLVKGVTWAHFPLYILNKAVSLAAVLFVVCSYLVGRVFRWHNGDPAIRLVVVKFCGLMGFSLACVHTFFSLCLLSKSYYPAYFTEDGKLNWVGELGLACGVFGLWALTMPAITTLPMMPKAIGGVRWKRNQRMGYVALAFVVGHLIALGLYGWLTPRHWPAGMLPISLLAFIAAVTALLVRYARTLKKAN